MVDKISVVMSVYNGSRFIDEQLKSIVSQSRLPDELLIIDDCSSDGGKTESIIREYERQYSFIRFVKNEQNLGWEASFMKGSTLAIGDIVFFSDQDDVWRLDKLELMINEMEDVGANVLLTSYYDTDSNLKPVEKKYTGNLYDNRYVFNKKYMNPKGLGAAMGIRKSFIDKYSYLWVNGMGHDRFFQIIAVVFDKLFYWDIPMIYHRNHGENATGAVDFNINSRLETAECNVKFHENLIKDDMFGDLDSSRKRIIYKGVRFFEKRYTMLKLHSVCMWFCLLFNDLRFYPSWRTWFGDLLSLIKC